MPRTKVVLVVPVLGHHGLMLEKREDLVDCLEQLSNSYLATAILYAGIQYECEPVHVMCNIRPPASRKSTSYSSSNVSE